MSFLLFFLVEFELVVLISIAEVDFKFVLLSRFFFGYFFFFFLYLFSKVFVLSEWLFELAAWSSSVLGLGSLFLGYFIKFP